MPHQNDEIRSYAHYDNEILKLAKLLVELGIEVDFDSDLNKQIYSAFRALYYSVYANECPEDWDRAQDAGALAGLGDLAFKINRAVAAAGVDALCPHLRSMVEGAVRMNAQSSVLDANANKNCELYVGCLALGAGLVVDLEDPVKSAGGSNPDVLLKFRQKDWSIAVKASQVFKPPTIFGAISSGVGQIERAQRPGVVIVNVKNILDHKKLISDGPYPTPDAAVEAVCAAIDTIKDAVRANIVDQDWDDLFRGKYARPLIGFLGQVTVPAMLPVVGRIFVPVKAMRILRVYDALPNLEGLNEEAGHLFDALNHELQRNSSS
ncbi:hypothetical protein [Bradyrhizobium elkanii]|uniref:hypothetical protein n=1 Tax=Bradyrhizobium elkanii TaxID=29448 RepID=UPI0035156A4F